jgi:hypothetical protein
MSSRYIPADIRRELRQEANFGCAYCGTPVVQYHHIIPFSEIEKHKPEEMIALCPNCHAEADAGSITRSELYDLKKSPHNSDIVDYMFYFEPQPPILLLGDAAVEFGERGEISLLQIKGKNILSMKYLEDRLHFNVDFYSKNSELIASITDGEWWAKTNYVWDLKYKKTWMKVWNSDEEVGLKLEYHPDSHYMSFKGRFYYNDEKVFITPSKMRYPSKNIEISGITYIIGGNDSDSHLLDSVDQVPTIHRPGESINRDSEGNILAGLFDFSEEDSKYSFIFKIGTAEQ